MKKILVVDDEMAFLGLLSRLLKKQFQTYEATGVNEDLRLKDTSNDKTSPKVLGIQYTSNSPTVSAGEMLYFDVILDSVVTRQK